MARPEEKSQSMLHRYLRSRDGNSSSAPRGRRRPYLAALCEDKDEAVRWKEQVVRELSAKVSEIQNASLGEARIRELNDEINKLIRESRHWDRRIRELGGRVASKTVDGTLLESGASHKGYFYFGAARELPGVAELLEGAKRPRHVDRPSQGTIQRLLSQIDSDKYFGYKDDFLEREEAAREESDRNTLLEAWPDVRDEGTPNEEWDMSWQECCIEPVGLGDERQSALENIALLQSKLRLSDSLTEKTAKPTERKTSAPV